MYFISDIYINIYNYFSVMYFIVYHLSYINTYNYFIITCILFEFYRVIEIYKTYITLFRVLFLGVIGLKWMKI